MKGRRIALVSVALLALLAAFAVPALAQGGGGSVWGKWSVKDGETAHLVTNHQGGANYRVKSDGPDLFVRVVVRDANDDVVASFELGADSTADVGVPDGGDLDVENPETGGLAATGGYKEI